MENLLKSAQAAGGAVGNTVRKTVRTALITTALAQAVAVGTLITADALGKKKRQKREAPDHGTFEASVDGSELKIYTSGGALFVDMIEAINSAKESIMFETYIWKGDKTGQMFMDAFNAAAKRGVKIHIILDHFANLVVDRKFYQQLDPSINFHYVYPIDPTFFTRPISSTGLNHSKVLVVDDCLGFVGGYNIGDSYHGEWRDTHVREIGPAVWSLRQAFVNVWNANHQEAEHIAWVTPDDWQTAVEVHPNLPLQLVYPIRRMYLAAIERAKKNIWVATPYFVPDGQIVKALKEAAHRGVDVRIMLPEKSNHVLVDWVTRGFYQELLEAGVSILLYLPTMNHSKIATIDGVWATVGTANLDRLSLSINYETNLEVISADFAAAMEKVFEADFADSKKVDPKVWEQRAGIEKITEKLLVPFRPLM